MISILLPSRGRPDNIRRLHKSLEQTTKGQWQLLVRLDKDDPTLGQYPDGFELKHLTNWTGERKLLSELWNDLLPYTSGDIVMHAGDDITFNSVGWDIRVKEAMPVDGIAVVHGNDLSPNSAKISTHSFVTRKWVDTLGYLCPPFFSSDYNDLWLTEIADTLERRIYLDDVLIEHHHPAFGKAELDLTHRERIARGQADEVDKIWADTAELRAEDVEKLRAVMK